MSKTIAIIDDDPQDLEMLKSAIYKVDPLVQCISFLFPDEAIRVISGELVRVPDYVMIDMNMPGKTGFECLLDLRKVKHLADTRIMMYSSKIKPEVKEALLDAGANFVFEKPVYDQWPRMVEKVLGKNGK